ncbi:N-acetylmuramic acid 6-phosphate etherase [Tessaracoccus sp.]
MEDDLSLLTTELVDAQYSDLDTRPTLGVLEAMNDAEALVPLAVSRALPAIALLVEAAAERIRAGGRLIYVGAGTSGRLGVLDASECPPTFHVSPETVQAIMAGGRSAVFAATESVEDNAEAGAAEVHKLGVGPHDIVVGIAASGRTPFVIGAVRAARAAGALTSGISCNTGSKLGAVTDHPIEVDLGPEVLAGSTRLKAGSATKQILNMISTAVMVRNGKTYGNLMVDVSISNEKLQDRGERLIIRITGCDHATAARTLAESGNRVKVAVVMIRLDMSRLAAESLLDQHDGRLASALTKTTGK